MPIRIKIIETTPWIQCKKEIISSWNLIKTNLFQVNTTGWKTALRPRQLELLRPVGVLVEGHQNGVGRHLRDHRILLPHPGCLGQRRLEGCITDSQLDRRERLIGDVAKCGFNWQKCHLHFMNSFVTFSAFFDGQNK